MANAVLILNFPYDALCSFDKGGYLFLPSYVMRTHGVKQQREAVKKVPRKQLEPVFEVWIYYGCHAFWAVLYYIIFFSYVFL